MMRGGRREGAGRPKGAKNKRTREVEDPRLPLAVRMEAASKAARFERPILASSNVQVIRSIEDLTDAELTAIIGDEDEAGDALH
jgi:hypothetical protein